MKNIVKNNSKVRFFEMIGEVIGNSLDRDDGKEAGQKPGKALDVVVEIGIETIQK